MVTKNFVSYLIQKYGNKSRNVTIKLNNSTINQGYHNAIFKEPVSKCYHNTNYSNKLKFCYHITKYIGTYNIRRQLPYCNNIGTL